MIVQSVQMLERVDFSRAIQLPLMVAHDEGVEAGVGYGEISSIL